MKINKNLFRNLAPPCPWIATPLIPNSSSSLTNGHQSSSEKTSTPSKMYPQREEQDTTSKQTNQKKIEMETKMPFHITINCRKFCLVCFRWLIVLFHQSRVSSHNFSSHWVHLGCSRGNCIWVCLGHSHIMRRKREKYQHFRV
jgi:hypothetical protein